MVKKGLAFIMIMVAVSASGTALNAADTSASQSVVSLLADESDLFYPTVVDFGFVKAGDLSLRDDQRGYYLNVLQDCWTTDVNELTIDVELENYILAPDDVVFVWKHKIFESCSNYIVSIIGLPCTDGKPPVIKRIRWIIPNVVFGYINPGDEYIFWISTTGMLQGTWDWFVVVECNDTTGLIHPPIKDGDIDDVIGANLGTVTYMPLIYGPEPAEVLDPDPGGNPPGRRPGEEGATRCWCFTVQPPPPE